MENSSSSGWGLHGDTVSIDHWLRHAWGPILQLLMQEDADGRFYLKGRYW